MNQSARAWLLLAGGICCAQDLHFKTRTMGRAEVALESELARALTDTAVVHKIVQYSHPPGTAEIESLLQNGVEVVAALPDNAIIVSAPGGQVRGADGAVWAGRLEPRDKMSPALTEGDSVSVIIEFHNDVTPEQQATITEAEGLQLQRGAILQGNHAIVTTSTATLRQLAENDEVAYLFPADPALVTDAPDDQLLGCAGMLTTNGAVGQYATIVHGWDLDVDRMLHLTYLFGSVTPKVPALTVQAEILRALNEWAKVSNITFQQGPNPAGARNILIKFVSGAHGDAFPFDGPKGALAHTFYPVPVNPETVAGDMHLDADENWHAGGDTDIFSVALHEAGHAIGLGHSDIPGDVMYPYYRSHMALSENDIKAVQSLYGAASGAAPLPITQPVDPGAGSTSPETLHLTLDPVATNTTADTSTLSGTFTGGKDPVSVQWQTATGRTGQATLKTRTWLTSAIPLTIGENLITLSAYDAAQQSVSTSVSITKQAPTPTNSTLPVSIAIRTPASSVTSTSAASMSLSGVANGGSGITRVTWQTSGGATGVANGTGNWLAAGVPLLIGSNTIVMRAWDVRGVSAWASMVVTRR